MSGASPYLPCTASSKGGWIDVSCESQSPGLLVVNEYAWDGWWAWKDGQPVRLGSGTVLNVQAPAGKHHYQFRYLPWDVLLGALLTLTGIILSVILHQRMKRSTSARNASY
jgi:uncharacterized membrane protein YfhO